MLSVEDAFAAALREQSGASAEPVLLPDRLARACVAALPVDGAGLSLTFTPDRRLPVGASDHLAAIAERLQFSLGAGPCLSAQRTGETVCASMAELSVHWPVYAGQLAAWTPFRSVVALPVVGLLAGVAALDLYGTPPVVAAALTSSDVQAVAVLVGAALSNDLATEEDRRLGIPAWLAAPPARGRHQVWLAIGHLAGECGFDSVESLARLRAHAFVHDVSLETAATLVLAGELPAG